MFGFIFGFIVGALIGWNLLPQPEWVKNLWNKGEEKVLEEFKDEE